MSIETFLRRPPATAVVAACGGTLALAVGLDAITEPEIGLQVFYLLPVLLAGWYLDRVWSLSTAVVSAAAWAGMDQVGREELWDPFVSVWNSVTLLLFLCLAAWLLFALKRSRQRSLALARVDSQTGVGNANAFNERVRWEIEMGRRQERPLTVAYLDMDIAGTSEGSARGAIGPEPLAALIEAVAKVIRSTDLVARVGEDQFAIVFPDTDRLDSAAVLLKISEEVLATTRKSGSPVILCMGAVTFKRPPESVGELRKIADDVMRSARERGAGVIEHQVVGT